KDLEKIRMDLENARLKRMQEQKERGIKPESSDFRFRHYGLPDEFAKSKGQPQAVTFPSDTDKKAGADDLDELDTEEDENLLTLESNGEEEVKDRPGKDTITTQALKEQKRAARKLRMQRWRQRKREHLARIKTVKVLQQ